MKFSSTVDALSKESKNMRRLLLLFGAANVLLGCAVLLIYDRPPIMVERTPRGYEIVNTVPLKRTKADIEQAVTLMLKARFDTGAVAVSPWLSPQQGLLRDAEQKELKARALNQAIIVRGVQIGEGNATADFDRALSIGEVRSALRTRVSLTLETVEPSETNPYGLRLASLAVEQLEKVGVQTQTGGSR